MSKILDKELATSKARAAGMAAATRGRARTFESRRYDDDGEDEIAEALEEREREAD